MCRLITPGTPSGKSYFFLLFDDMSKYMWVQLLLSKDQASAAIKNFHAAVELEIRRNLKTL
jgi:hypothetical protein